ncbi:MAG: MBOAT family protein [Desulfamplus sp.]|nr:MBOAT family protein [Desulfamplus sp.]
MVFSSLTFLFLFLPSVLMVYVIVPERFKNFFLMTVSLLFYFWGETYLIWIIISSILINYSCAIYIEGELNKVKDNTGKASSAVMGLILAVGANLMLLGYFKYANFFVDNCNFIIHALSSEVDSGILFKDIVLPLGISFYTFQAMSYTIDVYRGEVKATRNIVDFACYVSLFPQLVAGPIVRYKDIEVQLGNHKMNLSDFSEGIFRFVIGLAKKVLIANTMAQVADAAFSMPSDQLGTAFAWLGCLCYTLQIYFDFSGYSDMAIGLGHMFGFRFLENFNFPYIADSIQDFWRRWHISLSTWFRDYLYIPLGGNKKGRYRTYFNLFIVFLLCGLWHGASWNFILWGIYYGLFLIIERMGLGSILTRINVVLRHLYVIIIVMAGWVLFRADTLEQALKYLKIMAGFGSASADNTYDFALYCDFFFIMMIIIGIMASMPIMGYIRTTFSSFIDRTSFNSQINYRQSTLFCVIMMFGRLSGYLYVSMIFFFSVMILSSGAYNPFIYFRF